MSFVVIEGPDGVGKSTFVAAFGRHGWPTFKFPRNPRPATGLHRAEAMLDDMADARNELLAAGPAVVDRYDMSTLVYQGLLYGRAAGLGRLDAGRAARVLALMRSRWSDYAHPDGYVVLLGPRLRKTEDAESPEDEQPIHVQRAAYEEAARLMEARFRVRVSRLYGSPPTPGSGTSRPADVNYGPAAGDAGGLADASRSIAELIDDGPLRNNFPARLIGEEAL